nr:glycosyltransferase family 4 protein [Thioalkalivibrio sp. ALE19]
MDLLIVAGNARSLIANRGALIREVTSGGLTVGAAVPEKDYLPEVEELGIEIHKFPMARTSLNPFADLRTVRALRRIMRATQPEAVFGYTVKPVVYGALAARLAGVKRFYAMITGLGHAFTTFSPKTRVIRAISTRLYRYGVARSSRVFFQNPDDREEFIQRRILRDPERAVLVNGSGVDTERFAPHELPEGPPVFLFIGRLLTEKGVAEFVEAARHVHARWPGARFVAVGPHDPDLPHAVDAAEVERWKAEGVVEFVGGVKDVRGWLAASSVFVLPSYREGTPRSVLEAMSIGRPIITTDAPGCRETVEHGRNGFLVPPRDSSSLAREMEEFLEKPDLIGRMGAASRELAEDKYDVRKVNQKILRAMELV